MQWWHILLMVLGSLTLLFILSIAFYKPVFKRFWDIVLSFVALTILSPLFIVLTIVGAIAMKGNPFYVQKRPGKKEQVFKLIKYRTMSNAKDNQGHLLSDEKRLNKYGRFLRSTSLDELPELINIFIGDMSIIGPRPLAVEYLGFYTREENKRHDVRPGLTGWAQVNGRNSLTWESKFAYDIEYVDKLSVFFDFKILFLTIGKVLKRADIGQGNESPLSLHVLRKDCIKTSNGAIPPRQGVDDE